MSRREDKIQMYRVCDQVAADKPTFRVEMRLASKRKDGSIKLDRPFPFSIGVIFSKEQIGIRVFESAEAAIISFIAEQEREIEMSRNRITAALEALHWAKEQK
jgi:hypothetical protein